MKIKEEYRLSRNRFKELKYLCLQYGEYKNKILELENTIKASRLADIPSTATVSDSIGNIVAKKLELERRCELIEQTAIQCGGNYYKGLLENVTKGTPYRYLNSIYCSRSGFYRIRQKFFFVLSQKIE